MLPLHARMGQNTFSSHLHMMQYWGPPALSWHHLHPADHLHSSDPTCTHLTHLHSSEPDGTHLTPMALSWPHLHPADPTCTQLTPPAWSHLHSAGQLIPMALSWHHLYPSWSHLVTVYNTQYGFRLLLHCEAWQWLLRKLSWSEHNYCKDCITRVFCITKNISLTFVNENQCHLVGDASF